MQSIRLSRPASHRRTWSPAAHNFAAAAETVVSLENDGWCECHQVRMTVMAIYGQLSCCFNGFSLAVPCVLTISTRIWHACVLGNMVKFSGKKCRGGCELDGHRRAQITDRQVDCTCTQEGQTLKKYPQQFDAKSIKQQHTLLWLQKSEIARSPQQNGNILRNESTLSCL